MNLKVRPSTRLSKLLSELARTILERNFFDFESRLMPALVVINDKHLRGSRGFILEVIEAETRSSDVTSIILWMK